MDARRRRAIDVGDAIRREMMDSVKKLSLAKQRKWWRLR